MKRSSGILLPIFSLPSNYGIGTFGKEAYKFVDFLKKAGQTYWQILPLGPIGYGDSPYSTYSIFAGNVLFIDLDLLIEDGLLKHSDVNKCRVNTITYINYKKLRKNRNKVLYKAYQNGIRKFKNSYNTFINKNKFWIEDYALYMSLKDYFNDLAFNEWPDKKIKKREKSAINKYKKLLENRINFYKFTQFLFYKQLNKLRSYMKKNGIKLIGDIPIYVPLDSSDVWSNPKYFKLTSAFIPKTISGVPPDFFTRDGQLWGNPIYNYSYMKKDGYKWWIKRFKAASEIYDVIRIDHFRGLESFWEVKYGSKNARHGKWTKGPGMDLLGLVKKRFKNIEFISEDLGFITNNVEKLVEDFGFPGMKVLQFGFDSRDTSDHIPFRYEKNKVCYTGTHDNSTLKGYLKNAYYKDVNVCKKYFNIKDDRKFSDALIRGGMSTNCILFIAQMQDYLNLDDKARINRPGSVGENWKWRMKKNAYNNQLALKINELTKLYGR